MQSLCFIEIINSFFSSNFSYKYLERGREYFRQNRVLELSIKKVSQNVLVILGKVAGNSENFYSQKIYLKDGKVYGKCTCPVGTKCKHIIALLYKLFYSHRWTVSYLLSENQVKKEIDILKNFIFHSLAKQKKKKEESKEILIYRLHKDFSDYFLGFFKAKKKIVKGEEVITKGTALSIKKLSEAMESSLMDFVSTEDIEIIKLGYGMEHIWGVNGAISPLVKGMTGGMLLEKAIATERLFWENSTTPVPPYAEKIELTFSWEKIGNKFSLRPSFDLEEVVFLPTVPVFIYLKKENRFVKLKEELSFELLERLFSLPLVSYEDAQELSFFCEEIGIKVKGVEKPKIEEVEEVPIPVVYIEKNPNYYWGELPVKANLYFRYSDKEIPSHHSLDFFWLKKEEKLLKIIRDKKSEEDFLKRWKNTFFYKSLYGRGVSKKKLIYDKNFFNDIFLQFLIEEKPVLEQEGWEIVIGKGLLTVEMGDVTTELKEEEEGWFSLSFNLKVGEKEIPFSSVVPTLLSYPTLKAMPQMVTIKEGNKLIAIPKEKLVPIYETISQLLDRVSENELKFSLYEAHLVEVELPSKLREIRQKLKSFKEVKEVSPPRLLKTELRGYQKEGLKWLNFLYEYNLGGILADDMGLGKTVQTLSHLLRLKEEGALKNPSLIIVPTTLLANWEKEISRFTPDLKYITIYGKERKEALEKAFSQKVDIILTTYSLIMRDSELYKDQKFFYIILDESQKVKNYRTKTYRAIVSLKAEHKLALSGTPIENNLSELWATFNFLMPGFLGSMKEFKQKFGSPIEKGDKLVKTLLSKKIKPFILRRTKEEVLKELPPKVEIIKYVKFSEKEKEIYESIRVLMEKEVREVIEKRGFKKSQIYILEALLKLRQMCCHPRLLKIEATQKIKEASKLDLFSDLLEELISEGRKVLVFSQFVSMLEIIEKEVLKKKGYSYEMLTGSTRNRKKVIESFKKGKDVFLISLKAGGLGLNLTEADTVILYEPWWNPAVEMQATDRVYRIGQKNKVFVYKLIVENTVEEKILDLQKKKKSLQGLYEEGADLGKLTQEEVLALFE